MIPSHLEIKISVDYILYSIRWESKDISKYIIFKSTDFGDHVSVTFLDVKIVYNIRQIYL